jgi:hypothetical protein
MPTERPDRSAARRKQGCRAGLLTFLLLWIGALNDLAHADIFLSTGAYGEEHFSDRPPLNGPAVLVATSDAAPGRNAATSSVTATATTEIATVSAAVAVVENIEPLAQLEAFKADGPIAPGKSFTTGD